MSIQARQMILGVIAKPDRGVFALLVRARESYLRD
jgi:hypothetical protein